jgi:hypothetical protein
MTWGQKFRKMSAKALEALAEKEFSEHVVLEACRERAVQGYHWCDIKPSLPLDVRKTEAVIAMLEALQKQQLRIEWNPVKEKPDGPPYMTLHIEWIS